MAMMHGLGDVKKPLPESAAIVEELVHQQVQLTEICKGDCSFTLPPITSHHSVTYAYAVEFSLPPLPRRRQNKSTV